MKKNRLFNLLSAAVVFVFIISLFTTVPVLADDSTPPAPTEEPALPPTEEPTVEEVSTAEPVVDETPTEAPITEIESTPTSLPQVDPTDTPEVDTPAEILESAPEGVDVIVMDENGDAIPLATEEAAQIIMAGDPMWCPDGATPNNDPLNECTAPHASFSDLINDLQTNTGTYFGSGTIYVAYDYNATTAGDAGSDIIFDYGNLGLTSLVIQGGWNFATDSVFGTSSINLNSGNSLQFLNWGGGSLTLNDLILNGGDGLGIGDIGTNTADVILNNVDVINTNYGAYIGTDGDVMITNSNFNNNLIGLIVESEGDITLINVNANRNAEDGAILNNGCGCMDGNIFISSSNFNNNGDDPSSDGRGLIAHSNGDIELHDVKANGNAGGGAELDNAQGDGSISLSGTNLFNDNGYNLPVSVGLFAISSGDISLNGVFASGNGLALGGGAFLLANDGDISITNSSFNDNCTYCEMGFGLIAMGIGGDITLNGVTANNNGNDPANGYPGPALSIGAVIYNLSGNTFISNSSFNNNCTLGNCEGGGLQIMSFGDVYLDHVNANGNGVMDGGGAEILSLTGDVKIYCSSFSNNEGYGLSAGVGPANTITLNDVDLSGNDAGGLDLIGPGASITNTFDCTSSGRKPAVLPGLPLNKVNTTDGSSISLDCASFRGTELILPNGDKATFPCPLQDSANLDIETSDTVPSALPEGTTFGSGFTIHLVKDGEDQTTADPAVKISFKIPEALKDAELVILFWDGSTWVEVEGTHDGNGQFEASVNVMGTYLLASK